ncbi:hypothetical protein ACTWP5_17885 [Streptomyces sp. 4N509B]
MRSQSSGVESSSPPPVRTAGVGHQQIETAHLPGRLVDGPGKRRPDR